jgi:hypothetical protein
MLLLVCALAVYKFTQFADSLLPREPMPWIKLLFSIAMGYVTAAIVGLDNLEISGLSVAAVAGGIHSLLRLLTLTGDYAQRKSLR